MAAVDVGVDVVVVGVLPLTMTAELPLSAPLNLLDCLARHHRSPDGERALPPVPLYRIRIQVVDPYPNGTQWNV